MSVFCFFNYNLFLFTYDNEMLLEFFLVLSVLHFAQKVNYFCKTSCCFFLLIYQLLLFLSSLFPFPFSYFPFVFSLFCKLGVLVRHRISLFGKETLDKFLCEHPLIFFAIICNVCAALLHVAWQHGQEHDVCRPLIIP